MIRARRVFDQDGAVAFQQGARRVGRDRRRYAFQTWSMGSSLNLGNYLQDGPNGSFFSSYLCTQVSIFSILRFRGNDDQARSLNASFLIETFKTPPERIRRADPVLPRSDAENLARHRGARVTRRARHLRNA